MGAIWPEKPDSQRNLHTRFLMYSHLMKEEQGSRGLRADGTRDEADIDLHDVLKPSSLSLFPTGVCGWRKKGRNEMSLKWNEAPGLA